MNENPRIALITASILLVLAAGFYFLVWPQMRTDAVVAAAPTPVQEQVPTLAAGEASATADQPLPEHHPLPVTEPETTPLPALNASDAPFLAALDGLIASEQRARLLVSEQLIRRIVATIDNLPRERLGSKNRAFNRVPGDLVVNNRDGNLTLNPANEARYLPLLSLLKRVSAEATAKLYLRYYPLFNQAYLELGLPGRNFNDRLVQVIDHLLATPEVQGPIPLVQPKVLYQFADPALEARSAGQKLLIRMGPVNQAQLKVWLRQFRAQVTAAG